jgi:predicted transcriptional regulator
MLEALVGSTSAERVLLFLSARGEGYASEIARTYGVGPSLIQKQLDRMERDGLLVAQQVGRTRVYSFSPRFPFVEEVKNLMLKALEKYPDELQVKIRMDRRRPRRKGKPL